MTTQIDRVGQVWNTPMGRWTVVEFIRDAPQFDWAVESPNGSRWFVTEEFLLTAIGIGLLTRPKVRTVNKVRCDYAALSGTLDRFRDDVDEAALERLAEALEDAYTAGWENCQFELEFKSRYRR